MFPIIGIPACSRAVAGHLNHATPARYGEAVMVGAGGLPVLLPPVGEGVLAVLERIDGLLLSGSPSNVAPGCYGVDADATPEMHDPPRDATTLPLIRAALARGLPVLAICRGIQELNVALGGTLHQEVHRVAGRFDHRAEDGAQDQRYRPKHDIRLSGEMARMLGKSATVVNSLHGQAIDRLAPGLVVEAVAPDGTVEAVRVASAPGWAFGVQWHPEWRCAEDADSMALFGAFGDACRARMGRQAA
ncbi:MAG: gamma-glutamyl-gamma-aminobutyrate hydrolase family protein [Acetobacteraceae bacterium]|nr:gamma-glutamyl-gamma-aminobutyrate hydrolase family protein [Acetobacteraceae bacterium]